MILRTLIFLLPFLVFGGCSERVEITEPDNSTPENISEPNRLHGIWERQEYYWDTTRVVVEDTLVFTLVKTGRIITRLEIANNRFNVEFTDYRPESKPYSFRREGNISVRGDTLEASLFSPSLASPVRRTLVRFEEYKYILLMILLYDSGNLLPDQHQWPPVSEDLFWGDGIFWIKSAPVGDYRDRDVRDLGTFYRLD